MAFTAQSRTDAGDELAFLTIKQAAQLIRSREVSPVELTRAVLGRIEALDRQVNAFITVTGELALEQAKAAENAITRGNYLGALHGIPFALKDIIETAGILTSAHSKVLRNNYPKRDAAVVRKLYDAGAILVGKTATHEFAHGGPSFDLPWPSARNPWNTEHDTGGSSSGSAAAVAAGFVPAALGSDTGGSIRTPASLCGVAGIKPTYGLVSRRGVINNSFTFDHCGPFAWTVADCALVLQAVAGPDPESPSGARASIPDFSGKLTPDLRGVRVGVLRHFWEEDVKAGAEFAQALEAALDVLKRLGATVEVARMRPVQDYYDVKIIIAESELLSVHQQDLIERPQDFGEMFLGRVLGASLFQAVDYVQAQRERARMVAEMQSLYERFDVLVTAGLGPAPRLDHYREIGFWARWQRPNLMTPFSVSAGPALVQCIGYSSAGLPMSMQVVGRPFDEPTVFRVGNAYEGATAWRNRRPQLVAGCSAPPVNYVPHVPETGAIAPAIRALVEQLTGRLGLKLSENRLLQMCEAAPYALAMTQRIRRFRDRSEEPANVFQFPGPR